MTSSAHALPRFDCCPSAHGRLLAATGLLAMAARGRGRHGPPFRRGGFPFGPIFFGGPGGGFRRGPRARRGDVRAAALLLLAEEPRNGYQIMQEIEERSGGVWRPSPGSIYPALSQLEDEGLVRTEERDGRRSFVLTDAGRAYVEDRRDDLAAPWEEMSDSLDDDVAALFGEIRHVAAATAQIGHMGSARQIGEARKLLGNARRALYAILAGDEPAQEGEE
jgi:DNA-binding PadR family transcriptional regulator